MVVADGAGKPSSIPHDFRKRRFTYAAHEETSSLIRRPVFSDSGGGVCNEYIFGQRREDNPARLVPYTWGSRPSDAKPTPGMQYLQLIK